MLRMGSPLSDARPADSGAQLFEIPIDVIYDGDRLRDIDPAWAAVMAAHLEAGRRLTPIVVRRPEGGEDISHEFALVAGGHRLAAHRLADRLTIMAEIRECSRLEARREEVEENLIRNELSPLDRAFFLREHKKVYELLHPETAHGGDRKSRQSKDKIKSQTLGLDPKRFTAEAARLCNLSEATIQSAIALANALDPQVVRLLRGTAVARSAAELRRLADEPADRQLALAGLIRDGKADTVAKARLATGAAPTGEGDPQEELFRRICSLWERLDAKNRKRFAKHADLMEPTENWLRIHGRGRS